VIDYFESVVVNYLRADRAIFVNTECCIQLNPADNPDPSGPHWYCDAVAVDLRKKAVFLCEVSYSKRLSGLTDRLKHWHDDWELVCKALNRDSLIPSDLPIRPWLLIPEELIPLVLRRLEQIRGAEALKYVPRITTLEMVQPWKYKSWNRVGEGDKPTSIPREMQA
jgi:hypothetical protein